MIIIVDDTFIDRNKYHDVRFLEDSKYSSKCSVYSVIKTINLASFVKELSRCQLFCNHKTLQLYDAHGMALKINDNLKNRESLINVVTRLKIPRIEFSRGLETNYDANKIDKDLFYSNLNSFMDYFIQHNSIETKILFWGDSYNETAKMILIQKLMIQIRNTEIKDFKSNSLMIDGISVLYPDHTKDHIIDGWISKQLSKNEIIQDINSQIQ